MRYAATANQKNASDLELVNSCKHDRLRAALYGGVAPAALAAPAARPMSYEVVSSAEPANSATKAYFLVMCMSMISLLGLVVGGAVAV